MATVNKQKEKIQKKLLQISDNVAIDPVKALSDSLIVEKECIELEFLKEIQETRLYQGWCLIYLSRLKEAIELLTVLSDEYDDNDLSEEHIKILNAIGAAYNDISDNNNAFHYYSRSLKLSRKAGLFEREFAALNNIGTLFMENKNLDKAITHFHDLLVKIEKTESFLELKSAVQINLGTCYSKLMQYDEAEKYLLQSKNISENFVSRINDVDCLSELAAVKIGQNDIVAAKNYINDALSQCQESNKKIKCELLIMLGGIENEKKFFEEAIELSREINYKTVYSTSCLKLAEYYEEKGEFELSLKYSKDHFQTEIILSKMEAEKKFQNMEMEYELERNKKHAELFKIQNMELKESLNWMTVLNKIARETMSSLELNNIFNTVYQNINILMDAENFHIAFFDRENDKLDIIKAIENGIDIDPFTYNADENSSFAAWSIKNKKEVVINNLEKEYTKYIKKRKIYGDSPQHAKSMLTVPIFMRNDEIGVIAILSYYENAYKEEHVQLLKSLAAYLSIAIDNSRNFEKVNELNNLILEEKEELEAANKKILELATHDNLTGLANRRVFNETLELAMKQAHRRGEILAVLFIDLDNFKPVNDTWGHNVGDQVLIEIANRLRSILRSTDSVARIGGDEFLILLNPVKNRNEARKVGKKIIEQASKAIVLDSAKITIGMSIGISIYPEQEATADQLIIHADSAMYKIKKGEKNGIGFYLKD